MFTGRNREFEVSVCGSNTEPTSFSPVQSRQSVTIPQHIDEPMTEVMAPLGGNRQGILNKIRL